MNKIHEIQGLRGVAVLIVVLFHSQISFFSLGYLGVDLFFTISGYVVTLSCIRSLEKGDFNILAFYKKRLLRLFPAFFVVTCVALLISFNTQDRYVFKENSIDALYSLIYVSNFRLLYSLDYFSVDALSRIFTHYWSLSIEEQFYFIFPVVFVVLLRFSWLSWGLFIIFSGIYTASFINSENLAFYFSPGRFFALFAGVLIAINKQHDPFSSFKICFLLLSVSIGLKIFNDVLSPSIIFTAFASIVIQHSTNFPALRNKGLVWLGGISYSLYLVHWPILVFLTSHGVDTTQWQGLSLYLFASIATSIGLFHGVEQYFLSNAWEKTSLSEVFTVITISSATCAAILFLQINSHWFHPGAKAKIIDWSTNFKFKMKETWSYVENQNTAWQNNTPRIAIIGDSTAKDIYNSIYTGWEYANVRYYSVPHSCGISFSPPIGSHAAIKSSKDVKECGSNMASIISQLKHDAPDIIILATYWKENEKKDVFQVAKAIQISSGVKSIIFGPPVFYGTPVPIIASKIVGKKRHVDFDEIHKNASKRLSNKARNHASSIGHISMNEGFAYINRWDYFCGEGACPTFDESFNLLKGDKFHLTIPGAIFLGQQLKKSDLYKTISPHIKSR